MKTVQITCTGYTIFADWYESNNKDVILVVLPGYNRTRASQKDFTDAIVSQTGMSALVIEYSGHGDSPFELKDTRPAQHFLEVICAFDWVQDMHTDAKILVAGSSYGGYLAALLTNYRKFEKLVLRAPAIYEPAAFYTPWASRIADPESSRTNNEEYRKDIDALSKHPLLAIASSFAGQTLVVVHKNDEVVPRQTTDAYIKAFKADSFVAEGFSHGVGNSFVSQQRIRHYQSRIADWLRI